MAGITYAIIVAIENYHESTDFPKVDFAKKDAEDLIAALRNLKVESEDVIALIDERATGNTITEKVKKICSRALENDRIIFYFSGHGFYEGGENLLAPVDAMKTAKTGTCVSVKKILGYLKASLSKQKIVFLDCCHSGFEAGEFERDGEDSFSADELAYFFKDEEYCVGFTSCKADEKSISHIGLQNGVWTHFLIKALNGDAKGIYDRGILFSDKLQSYLNKETRQFVKLNTDDKKDQTPVRFGTESDKFIIADLTSIFDERRHSKKATDLSFRRVSLLNEDSGKVKDLPGFVRRYHKVPDRIGSAQNSFIQGIAGDIIDKEIKELSKEIKSKLKYRRAEINASVDSGSGSILTPYFDYSITISQSETDATDYIVERVLNNFKNTELLENAEFNKIFETYFDKLVFYVPNEIDIEVLIDKIEGMSEDSPVTVDYSPSDMSSCTISIEDSDYDIFVLPYSISITTIYQTSPAQLVAAFRQTRKAILANDELKALE